MSHTSWSSPASIGSAPPYHLDPAPGGLPVFSPDGHWRWAGDHWELREDPVADAEQSAADPAADPGAESSADPAADRGTTASLD